MRRIRVDIAGTTDANGNFSQIVQLDKTGEFRNVKVAVGTAGPAEWTLSSAGTPLTYGRGRRVTLGPELLEPFDTLTVSCTGGPVSSPVTGSCTGQAGTEQEIVTAYVPAPNTIALDSLVTQRLIDTFTQSPNVVVANRLYVLPAGTQSVRMMVNQNQSVVTFTNLKIVGAGTGFVYIFPSSGSGTGGFDEWFKPAPVDGVAGLLFSLNTTGSANGIEVELVADLAMNFVVASLIGAGTSQSLLVNEPIPSSWQSPSSGNEGGTGSIVAGGNLTIVPAPGAGLNTFLHGLSVDFGSAAAGVGLSLQTLSGVSLGLRYDGGFIHTTWHDFKGRNIGNNGVQLHNNSGGVASGAVNFGIDYTQA